jgi:hypothetical protein
MFSSIDVIVFPNSCEVIQIASQQFVYPIMKNGSSNFYRHIAAGNKNNWKILKNEEITKIDSPLITFIRDPRQRFISGVHTFFYHCKRDNPGLNLDANTILWFVNNYLFLDRHYAPQFYWLINLSRYCNDNTLFDLRPMTDLSYIVSTHDDADVPPMTEEFVQKLNNFNWEKLELYFYLDQILFDSIGQNVTYRQLLDKVKKCNDLYKLIFEHSQIICQQI